MRMGKAFACAFGVAVMATVALADTGQAYAGFNAEDPDCIVADVIDNRGEYANLVIAQVSSYVNVRDYPDVSTGKVVGKLYNNSVGYFIEEVNGWYKITSGSVTGYVSGEYCIRGIEAYKMAEDVKVTIATVTASSLRVRKKATTSSTVLGTLAKGEELEVISTSDGFAKVDFEDGTGYISLDYVDLHTEFVVAESIEEERARLAAEKKAREAAQKAAEAALAKKQAAAQASAAAAAQAGSEIDLSASLGEQVVQYALQFVGNPYVYGGTSLTNGCDCSGFTQSVYKYFGVTLPRTGQRSSGYAVSSLSEAQPGDLIFYSGHVAIYIGNGQIVHAANAKKGICTGSATYTKIIAIRRIF